MLVPAAYANTNGILPAGPAGAHWWNLDRVHPEPGGQVRYRVPGVFKRSDQITPALTLMERRHPLALDSEAAFFQSMQLSNEDAVRHVGWAPYPAAADAAGAGAGGPATLLDDAGRQAAAAAPRLRNLRSGVFPAFVHYNGPAKAPWKAHPYTQHRVRAGLWYRRAAEAAGPAARAAARAAAWAAMRDRVVFMRRSLAVVGEVDLERLCGQHLAG